MGIRDRANTFQAFGLRSILHTGTQGMPSSDFRNIHNKLFCSQKGLQIPNNQNFSQIFHVPMCMMPNHLGMFISDVTVKKRFWAHNTKQSLQVNNMRDVIYGYFTLYVFIWKTNIESFFSVFTLLNELNTWQEFG